ncbi:uncharacterized protein EAE97_006267 [Botrytis byssoidea]|uniref:Uncharacterized protein n=1 Tax=Botrytis byssoidea TaxID=139641 RepID=A0A9P5ILN5_9HELO|nr:uncharacterized protein EAE97_006267 [Botrytis byssoidea]KAF7942813.1 hypothetical protein EAE97_006267 [Botrytis byssoidea]
MDDRLDKRKEKENAGKGKERKGKERKGKERKEKSRRKRMYGLRYSRLQDSKKDILSILGGPGGPRELEMFDG